MKELDLTDIFNKLVGHTDWVGETNSDNRAFENMNELEGLLYHLLNRVRSNSELTTSTISGQKLKEQADEIIKEVREILP